MKKMFFVMLTLTVLGAASMNAQVTIGDNTVPHSGAVLDLKSTTQGLHLPNVVLNNNLTVFGLPDTDPAADAKGMYVYNTNSTIGEGVYVWDGYQWILVKASVGEKPVEKILIRIVSGSNIIKPRGTTQLEAILTPTDASNANITWSIENLSGFASINQNGKVTGHSVGRVMVYAKANNGVSASYTLYITSATETTEHIGNNDYKTITYGNLIWMTENTKEGVAAATFYNDDPELSVGSYYNASQASSTTPDVTPCPAPWRVPTKPDFQELISYAASGLYANTALGFFVNPDRLAGYKNQGESPWEGWGMYQQLRSSWWTDVLLMPPGDIELLTNYPDALLPIRCVRNK